MNIEEMKSDYDWQEAFAFASNVRVVVGCSQEHFGIDDVAVVHSASAGENDGDSWVMAGQLKDGRWFFLDAWCDYTGWDCQAGGDAQLADTLENLIQFAMPEDARSRLGLEIADHGTD